MSRQVAKLPRLQFADVIYRALNGSFARWNGYKLFVAATQQIADWNKKLGMFEYVDHYADQVPSLREVLGGRIWLETTGSEPSEFQLTVPFKSVRSA